MASPPDWPGPTPPRVLDRVEGHIEAIYPDMAAQQRNVVAAELIAAMGVDGAAPTSLTVDLPDQDEVVVHSSAGDPRDRQTVSNPDRGPRRTAIACFRDQCAPRPERLVLWSCR